MEIDVKDEDCRVLIGWLCMAIMIEMDVRRELERWDDNRQYAWLGYKGTWSFVLLQT
jgi:hypothetical protein